MRFKLVQTSSVTSHAHVERLHPVGVLGAQPTSHRYVTCRVTSHAHVERLHPVGVLGAQLAPVDERLGDVVARIGGIAQQRRRRIEVDRELLRQVVLVPRHAARITSHTSLRHDTFMMRLEDCCMSEQSMKKSLPVHRQTFKTEVTISRS